MLRPPTSSTLFPYTTLFRSYHSTTFPGGPFDVGPVLEFRRLRRTRTSAVQRSPIRRSHRDPARRDRKSTRLNSSHQIISYAVFCLKKKKKHYVNDNAREMNI